MTSLQDRYYGALLGLAAGDALGTTLEFQAPGTFTPISDIVGGGPFNLQPGEWTDDTSMALCLAESLVEKRDFDPIDQLERYVRWYRHGHLSSNGYCFDIGNATRSALARFERTHKPRCGSGEPFTAGNGSLMRLAPIPMFYLHQPALAIEKAGESSLTTHGLQITTDACRFMAGQILGALSGASKDELLTPLYAPIPGYWKGHRMHPEIARVAEGSFRRRQPPEINGRGYVVDSLEAALWAFYHSLDFRYGALLAVNLGDDSDTTGAIYGQLAGAYYGATGMPLEWLHKLARRTTIETLARQLFELAPQPARV